MQTSLVIVLSLGLCGLVGTPANAAAPACTARSGQNVMPLIELYTSEGCNSCPPADRWLSRLVHGAEAPAVVALAFHVDYWDNLGWRDRFGSPAFSQRQEARVAAQGGGPTYTPQLMLNGRVWRSWSSRFAAYREIEHARRQPADTRLALSLTPAADAGWSVVLDVDSSRPGGDQEIFIALYEDGLSTEVRAGENQGKRLAHDRVVRWLLGPYAPAADGHRRITVRIAPDMPFESDRRGVAAFVQHRASGEILQALARPFCPPGR